LKGNVVGGGFVLSLACDFRIAANDISMSLPEAYLGWPLPWGCVPRLVREVGPQAAKDLILACPVIDGPEAFRLGLVRETVLPAELSSAVSRLATEIAKRPAVVIEIIKRQINEAAEDMASTARGQSDIERMLVALADEEAQQATREGLNTVGERFNLSLSE
jgi:enoyl-CoA hydratase/carnithine racemase